MSCENCTYFTSGGGKWSKGYCSYYRSYCSPWESCSNETSSGSGGCFLTTACCEHKGLPDNCEELEAMRKLRDTIKTIYPSSVKCINMYYEKAPMIVDNINNQKNKAEILESIYKDILHIKALMDNDDILNASFEYMYLFCKCINNYSE